MDFRQGLSGSLQSSSRIAAKLGCGTSHFSKQKRCNHSRLARCVRNKSWCGDFTARHSRRQIDSRRARAIFVASRIRGSSFRFSSAWRKHRQANHFGFWKAEIRRRRLNLQKQLFLVKPIGSLAYRLGALAEASWLIHRLMFRQWFLNPCIQPLWMRRKTVSKFDLGHLDVPFHRCSQLKSNFVLIAARMICVQ